MKKRIPKWGRWSLILVGLVLLLVWIWPDGEARQFQENATFKSRRGTLEINVVEGGNIQALESQEIKCEVRMGYQGTKILKIVEEGYQVTEEDVSNGKVLVELDSSELEKLLAQQEIQVEITDVPKLVELETGTLSGTLLEGVEDSPEMSMSELFNQAMEENWVSYTNALANLS